MSNIYTVELTLVADDVDALMDRMRTWDFADNEGVMWVSEQPDAVVVPPDLALPPPSQITTRRLDSVDPTEGPAAGDTEITLHGAGFTNIGGVRFEGDGQPGWAWSFTVVDDATIICRTPPMGAGPVDVIAFDGDPGDAILPDGFTFL